MKLRLLIFLLALCDALIFFPLLAVNRKPAVFFMDVGQGDSFLVSSGGGGVDILIDTGPGKSVLYELEKILGRRDRYIDAIVLTHPHSDHFGGLEYVFSRYDAGIFLWSGAASSDAGFAKALSLAERKRVPFEKLAAGDKLKSKGIYMTAVYSPPEFPEKDFLENDGSIVLYADVSGLKGIFPGDVGLRPESRISSAGFPSVDFLKVGHHGSASSSSYGFLKAVNPSVAVLSVGKNSYGLPKKEVLDRFASLGIPVYRTDELGALKIEKIAGKIIVSSLNL